MTLRVWHTTHHPSVQNERVCPHIPAVPSSCLFCRYVYDHIGGDHSAVIPELAASVATFVVTTLWLGPCDIVYLWSVLNCFGLNFELWVQKLAECGPLAQIEVGGKIQGWDWLESVRSQEVVALLLSGVTRHTWSLAQEGLPTPLLSARVELHPVQTRVSLASEGQGLADYSAALLPLGWSDAD